MRWVQLPPPKNPVAVWIVVCETCRQVDETVLQDIRDKYYEVKPGFFELRDKSQEAQARWHQWVEDYQKFNPVGFGWEYNLPEVELKLVWFEGRRILRGECAICNTTHWSERR
jgi:hypothetical protein